MTDSKGIRELRLAAEQSRHAHHAPYSGLLVLAAVETDDGRAFGGTNVEVANYSLTKHAEELAILAALQAGGLDPGKPWIRRLYVAGGAPCGSCRQFAWEFGRPDSTWIEEEVEQEWLKGHSLEELEDRGGLTERRFDAMLPGAFGPADLVNRPGRPG